MFLRCNYLDLLEAGSGFELCLSILSLADFKPDGPTGHHREKDASAQTASLCGEDALRPIAPEDFL
jgi:hypothetical protein